MGRGQLRIYLGAAPGVGKTFTMLEEAHRRVARGTDVVIGFVETHGRKHTERMTDGLEVVPRPDDHARRFHPVSIRVNGCPGSTRASFASHVSAL